MAIMINIRSKLRVLTGVVFLLGAGTAMAHHSQAQYEETQTVTLTGTVSRFLWTNPHVWIFMAVEDAQTGEQVEWRFESGSPAQLAGRGGWDISVLKPGQLVSVISHPRKDGGRAGHFLQVTLNDTVLSAEDGY